ncbi:prolyl oligopeptidase family serine peptidase [Alteromonas sp. 345S023]|uniref:Prolyl oligopeptidase family serine peptidase n=1 Tax=Alteromonas profundi TaxID=2696062 RepID=A0A7X5LIQ6_9ALTE|nr:prolyl oligopeptidase family serine peptidase [Alteromonas profundi]NDV90116.1 prolyl oligopeptidase family serine peptidase [Alteromonas profundi]
MKLAPSLLLFTGVSIALSGCISTETLSEAPQAAEENAASVTKQSALHSNEPHITAPQKILDVSIDGENAHNTITLKQIMADPQWIGRTPLSIGWSVDDKHFVYEIKRNDSNVKDVYFSDVVNPFDAQKVPLNDLQQYRYKQKVERDDGVIAYTYKDSVYVQFTDGNTVQLTRGGAPLSKLSFMTDGRLLALSTNRFIAIDLDTGEREEILSWNFADKPQAVAPPKDYVAEQQQSLIDYIKKKRQQKREKQQYNDDIAHHNTSVSRPPFYFDKNHKLAGVSVSPSGDFAIVATKPDIPTRASSDTMPHYIQEDGRIAAISVRQRVSDAEPVNHQLWLLNLKNGEKSKLNYFTLPGFNDDVLADVKRENAAARGETYQVNRLPRAIRLMSKTSWNAPTIRWNRDGSQVAVMLEAWDNKDRWIATVDFGKSQLVNQHRLHDDAWINYRHNTFGWLHTKDVLYFQSEQSGYAHIYLQTPGQRAVALTEGEFVTSSLTLSDNDNWIYFKANKPHPGIFEIYRVNLDSKEIQALTHLGGMTDYKLGNSKTTLLLKHSKINQPPELFVKKVGAITPATQITHTVSETFKSLPWALPSVIAIPSSHTNAPIYARVYLPNNYREGEPNKAVVFNHGAGYKQNAHYGWSDYFREYMFNSMLAQQGYVVLDMDYRASAGYGRDWRTAIYRNMGQPELEDLRDGVNWLVNNANVDRERIGTYGGSYGGFLTFMAMFKMPDLFAAGAALRPVTDWAHYNTGYTSNILNTPDIDPISYQRSSPIYFAEGLEKPLLINAPMVDNNVFFQDTVRLVQRLIELEKTDFETAIYPVEPHGFVQPSSWLDEYRRIHTLFEENL